MANKGDLVILFANTLDSVPKEKDKWVFRSVFCPSQCKPKKGDHVVCQCTPEINQKPFFFVHTLIPQKMHKKATFSGFSQGELKPWGPFPSQSGLNKFCS